MMLPLRFLPLALFFAATAYADLKITTRNSTAGQSSQGTTYVKGARQRSEMQYGPMQQVTIMQCDKRQTITVSDACRTYMVAPMDEPGEPEGASATPPPSGSSGRPRKGGTLTINSSSTRTGETQPMFGYTARRIKSSMSMTSSPDACNPNNTKIENDGWYADFTAAGVSCSATPRPPAAMGHVRPDCQDTVRYTGNYIRNPGYPLKLTTTVTDAQGSVFTTTQETLELSKATLDPALFDVPANYRQVQSYEGLMCAAAMSGMGSSPSARAPASSETPDTAGPDPDSESTAARRRRGGRGICIAPFENHTETKVELEEWRDVLGNEFERMRIPPIKLEGETTREVRADAAEKGCRYILYTDVTELKQPSAGRKLGGILGKGVGANPNMGYATSLHVELMPTDDYYPRLEVTVPGNGDSLDSAGEKAMSDEAQQVVTEFSKPWPR